MKPLSKRRSASEMNGIASRGEAEARNGDVYIDVDCGIVLSPQITEIRTQYEVEKAEFLSEAKYMLTLLAAEHGALKSMLSEFDGNRVEDMPSADAADDYHASYRKAQQRAKRQKEEARSRSNLSELEKQQAVIYVTAERQITRSQAGAVSIVSAHLSGVVKVEPKALRCIPLASELINLPSPKAEVGDLKQFVVSVPKGALPDSGFDSGSSGEVESIPIAFSKSYVSIHSDEYAQVEQERNLS